MSEQEQIVENYEEIVRRSGLVPKEQLELLLKEMLASTGTTDSQILANRLEEARYVTAWQNSKLMRGCYKGFFLGRYKLQAHLGTGGMSTVYLGEHTLMRRRVAIKVLHHKLTDSHSYLERFYRESRATAGLDHENIVRAFDIDCQESHHYLVMEYVDGLTLKQFVDKKGPLDYEQAADYMRQAALGLQEAHAAGLIHRDVKPGNLMLNQKNVVKVLDLGMALDRTEVESLTLKYNESMLGTADYLAPEQALNSHTVDVRADVYALGCTLYFALTGHPPFDEGSMALRLMKHQTEEPPSIKVDRADAPDDLLEIIDKMMAKRPKDRYQTMAETAQALERWIDDQAPDAAARLVFDNDEGHNEDDDTVNDVNPYTLIGEGHEVGISKAHVSQSPSDSQGRMRVTCPNCNSVMLTKPPSEKLLCKCPGCSGLMSVPGVADLAREALNQIPTLDAEVVVEDDEEEAGPPVPQVPPPVPAGTATEEQSPTSIGRREVARNLVRDESARPADVGSWKFRDMVSAIFDGDLRLVECIISMSVRSVGEESFAELLSKLLKAAVELQKQREAPLEPQLLRAVITALGSNATHQATLCLGRVVLGIVELGPNDRLTAEAAIHAMVANPTDQREDFLINALANAEQARPRGRGRYTASELRATIASAFLKQASGRVRKGLRARLNQPNLHAEARTLIEQILRQ